MKKKIGIIFIFIAFFILYFYGCNDSLGLDPNVEIIPVEKNTETPDTTDTDVDDSTENQKNVNNIIWNLQEVVLRKYPLKDTVIDWESKIIKNDIRIDTSERILKIWMTAEMETTAPNNIFPWRHDRVLKFGLVFKASLNSTMYFLNGNASIGRELYIIVEDMRNGMRYHYRGFQFESKIIFNEINRIKKQIVGQIIVDFGRSQKQETRAFLANFIINY